MKTEDRRNNGASSERGHRGTKTKIQHGRRNKEWDEVPGVRDGTKDERTVKKKCG